ncbi:hypothetical protein KUTeg_015733 [Tegillarca granosa]|uniref:Ig-like domain-containing protein n=1 Tax=Tegillarca granosa TaxID=220873 RepID=A0ABQ9ERX6_TEGGR|nr:hypothetical protein KUTeg_015733 [Tegillarca granosa]
MNYEKYSQNIHKSYHTIHSNVVLLPLLQNNEQYTIFTFKYYISRPKVRFEERVIDKSIGTWSIWGPWSICAVTCGTSVHSRYRTCKKTSKNDSTCVGNIKETKECTTTPCLAYGTWTTWQSWTTCDVTCGGGRQDRSRTCLKVAATDLDCMGRSTQQQTCNKWECPDCSKVCSIGTLNRECDACECVTNIQGRVKNSNGGYLNNVSIAHESTPYKHLTTTKIDGSFQLNNVCRQQYIIFQRSGYQDTIVKITSSDVFVTMYLKKYPVITTQPKTHLRLEGESVEFCCNVTGSSLGINRQPLSNLLSRKTRLRNGNLVNDSFQTDGTSLILKGLKFDDSGTILCRANSPIGAVFSNSVSLSVRVYNMFYKEDIKMEFIFMPENPDDLCIDAYESHEINLPSDCIQKDTNSIKYDIGKCLPKACRKNDSNKVEKCSVDKRFCCSPSGREKRIIQCSGYSFPLYVTTSCECGACEDIVITVHGQAIGETKGPLRFGTIKIEGETVGTTGLVGDFSFNIPRGVTQTLKVIQLNEEIYGRIYVHDQSGSSLQIAGETEIELDQAYFNYASIGNLADAKLWGLNPETGIWEEQANLSVQKSKRKKRQSEFLVGTMQISAWTMWNIDVLFAWTGCYFKSQVFEGDTQLTNYNVRVIYRTDRDIDNVIRYQEHDVRSDEAVLVSCRKDGPLTVYIEVEKDGKKVLVDTTNPGLNPSVQSFIQYQVLEANRAVSAEARMIEALRKNYSGNEVWYPPLNSFKIDQLEYRTCFIKIGTVNANSNLLFRVTSRNDASTVLGIHEKGLTNGSTCIEYRCSVQNPVLDINRRDNNDFAREPKTYTFVQILPVGQVCTVLSEVKMLRNQEQLNIGLSSRRTNVGKTFFEANIPDNECDGLYFHKSKTFEEIEDAKDYAIKECNKGVHDSLSESKTDMTPDVGLALTFRCL